MEKCVTTVPPCFDIWLWANRWWDGFGSEIKLSNSNCRTGSPLLVPFHWSGLGGLCDCCLNLREGSELLQPQCSLCRWYTFTWPRLKWVFLRSDVFLPQSVTRGALVLYHVWCAICLSVARALFHHKSVFFMQPYFYRPYWQFSLCLLLF